MKSRETEQLIQAVLDGSTERSDGERLQDLLRNDPVIRRTYWQYVAVEQALAYRFASQATGMARSSRGLTIQHRNAMFASVAAAAAAVVIIGFVLYVIRTPSTTPPAGFTAAPQSIFRVLHSRDQSPPENALMKGSTLVLEQGTVELRLAGGTLGIVQAPARLTVEDETALRLDQGIGWFRVPAQDHGFRVRTHELMVTDLGTEFGVVSTPSANDEIHVLTGRVEARATGVRGEEAILKAGEARRCDPIGRLVRIDPSPDIFIRSLPTELPYIAFDFDRIDHDALEVGGNHPIARQTMAHRTGSTRPPKIVEGVSGKAIALDGKGEQIVTDWPGIADNMPRTVSVWIRVDPDADLSDHPSIVGWGAPETSSGKWKVLLAQDAAGTPAVPRISLGGHAYDAPITANDGHWHHLTVTFSGGMTQDNHPEIEIFFDGHRHPLIYRNYPLLDGPRKPETLTRFGAIPLTIGGPIDPDSGTFEGEIDDLRIYFGVLPEAAIISAAHADR